MEKTKDVKDIKNTPCQICGNLTNKGVHFQVDCCRACAAFYRRSLESETVYKCVAGTQNCDLKNKDTSGTLCKYCRFKKCEELGMRVTTKKRYSPDPEDSKSNIPPELAQNIVIFGKDISKDRIPKTEMYEEILSLENLYISPPLVTSTHQSSFLHRIYPEFIRLCEKFRPKEAIKIADSIDPKAFGRFNAEYKAEISRILMCTDEFSKFDYNTKLLLHDHAANIFFRIFCYHISLKFGCHQSGKYLVYIYDNYCWDLENVPGILTLKSTDKNHVMEANVKHWNPICAKQIKLMYKPLMKLKLSDFEMVYLLGQILWSTESIKDLHPEIHDFAYKMIDQISIDLHRYYQENKIFNYSPRLIQIIRLIDSSKILLNDLKSHVLISQVSKTLDFNADLSKLCDH